MSSSMKAVLKGMVEKWKDISSIMKIAETLELDELKVWIEYCTENASKNTNYSFLLQDLVNLLGSRLGFKVELGKYRKGPDGIWKFEDKSIVVETKATSFYLDFKKMTDYITSEKATSGIAVSSEFSADKIATVKGGYPKIRLITTDSLLKLAELKKKEVITTKHVTDILVPQETVQLDGLVELIYGIVETKKEVGVEEGITKDRFDINDVPENIKELGEVARAMYIVLKHNPDRAFESWELTEEITKNFPATFANKNPGLGLVWSGDALKGRGYIIVQRYQPDPKNYPDWYKRRYKFKK